MIEKDKIRLLIANASYEKNNLIKTLLTKIKYLIEKYFFESQSIYHSLFNLSISKELTLVLNHH